MNEILTFLKQTGTYYLATTEGDQPRVRPFGTIHLFEGKLYLLTAKSKSVSKQVEINSKVEICAYDGEETRLRIQALLINDERKEAKVSMMATYPEHLEEHPIDDPDTQVLYLKDGIATFSSFS